MYACIGICARTCMHELYVSYVPHVCIYIHVCASTYMSVHAGVHMCVHGATELRLFFLPMESMTQSSPASMSEYVLPTYQAKTGAARGISY